MATPNLTIAGNKCVYNLGAKLAKLDSFAHDYGYSDADVGAVVEMPLLATEASDFNVLSNNYEGGAEVGTAKINVDKHLIAGFNVTQMQMNDGLGAFGGLFADMGLTAGRAIAAGIEKAVIGQVTDDLSSSLSATLTATKAGFANLWKTCADANIDPSYSVLVLNPENYAKFLDAIPGTIVNLQTAIETGIVENFLGFKRVMSSKYVDEDLEGFIATVNAIGVVSRRLPLIAEYPVAESAVSEESGLAITLLGHQNYATGKFYISANALFGTGVLDETQIVRLKA